MYDEINSIINQLQLENFYTEAILATMLLNKNYRGDVTYKFPAFTVRSCVSDKHALAIPIPALIIPDRRISVEYTIEYTVVLAEVDLIIADCFNFAKLKPWTYEVFVNDVLLFNSRNRVESIYGNNPVSRLIAASNIDCLEAKDIHNVKIAFFLPRLADHDTVLSVIDMLISSGITY